MRVSSRYLHYDTPVIAADDRGIALPVGFLPGFLFLIVYSRKVLFGLTIFGYTRIMTEISMIEVRNPSVAFSEQ